MGKKQNRHMSYKTVDIAINAASPEVMRWLHDRLFLFATKKFSFLSPQLGKDKYIFVDNILEIPSGFTIFTKLNGIETLGEIKITVSILDSKTTQVSYQHLPKLSDFAHNLILDIGIHFDVLDNLPKDILITMRNPEVPDQKLSSILDVEFFIENATSDQFTDWFISESKDILKILFPALGWLLEIQPPQLYFQTNYERKLIMEGRLYNHGCRGSALFLPNPPINQECICFELRQLSATRLRVVCKANNFATTYFRELLGKVGKNWPESREAIQRFLIEHRGETVVPFIVSMGPEIDTETGQIVPEIDKFHRLEFKFKGTPAQFATFIINFGNVLSDKYKKEIVDIFGSRLVDAHAVQVKAVFFPIDFLEPEQEKGVYGEIIAQAHHSQSSFLKVEVKRENWNRVKKTWELLLDELKRQDWIVDKEKNIETKAEWGIYISGNLNGNLIVGDNNDIDTSSS